MANSPEQLQVIFRTKQRAYAVPAVPLCVPDLVETGSLNDLLNKLLRENQSEFLKPKDFDFLAAGELVRTSLRHHLQERCAPTEVTVEIEYFERIPAPEPQNSLQHNDWVSGVQAADKWILTGSYDNTLNIWTTQGKLVLSQKEHTNVIKDVSWLKAGDPSKGFVTVSHDLTGLLWEWQPGAGTAHPKAVLRGHEKGIESVGVSPNSEKLATGGLDTNLKIWSASCDFSDEEPAHKKSRGPSALNTRTPQNTLQGHKESITGIEWVDNRKIFTVSMDHNIYLWDAEECGVTHTIPTEKAILAGSWSHCNNTLITGSADRHIRLYDPRCVNACKSTFTSHNLWVADVSWSKYNPHLFISGSYDSCVKLWDTRCPKTCLYDMQGHNGQVFGVDWSNNKYFVSGGSDNLVHIFKNKHID